MKPKILCFGDSNTWGFIPASAEPDSRYGPDVRWTGILTSLLADKATLLEEGLNSRTTDLDYPDVPGKNGLKALPSILAAQAPIDVFVVLLGSNDLKQAFHRTPESITKGLDRVLACAQSATARQPIPVKMLVLAPPIPKAQHVYDAFRYDGLEVKAHRLGPLYHALADHYGAEFLDLADKIPSSCLDGVHLDPAQHRQIAELLHPILIRLLST
jgi:lysophospholipase L1-like esterase